jgi:transcriptional enhancer factor
MSTEDLGPRRNRHSSAHYGHLRSRHESSKYDYPQGGSSLYQGLGHLPSSLALAKVQAGQEEAPYTFTEFRMGVDAFGQSIHNFCQLSSNSRLPDFNGSDTTSWHKQYPELNFHRTDELKKRHVLVCDASIKIMTMERPKDADLNINFSLRSQVDLSVYDALECRTRFFEGKNPADQLDEHKRKVKETRTEACYSHKQQGRLRLTFGANFWAQHLQKLSIMLRRAGEEEQNSRVKYEALVRRELQYMTAAQDIYGVKDGEATCVLTLLWRFNQTRISHEPGRVKWRVVDFGRRERRRAREEAADSRHSMEALLPMVSSSSSTIPSIPTSASSLYPSLSLDFQHQAFAQHPPPLDLDALGLDSMSSDFSHPNSATAPSLTTDYSQTNSLPSIAHCQDMSMSQAHAEYPDTNDFEFNGGHITISGCLEPAINLGAYESFGSQHPHGQILNPIHSIAGLEHHDPHQHENDSFGDLSLGVSMASCYPTKPSWSHPSLVSQLENVAEEVYSDLMAMQSNNGHVDNSMGGVDVGHGILHGLENDGGLWKLQSAFGEATGVGAHDGIRKDSVAERMEDSHGHSLLDFMDRSRDERYRPY